MRVLLTLFCFCFISLVCCRRHVLILKSDARKSLLCSQFGYFNGGYLSVYIEKLRGDLRHVTFTLDKTISSSEPPYTESDSGGCVFGRALNTLLLSFSEDDNNIVVHDNNSLLRGLMLETGAVNIDDNGEGIPQDNPGNLAGLIKIVLDSLNLAIGHSDETSQELKKLVNSFPVLRQYAADLPRRITSGERYPIYLLLRNLSELVFTNEQQTSLSDVSGNSSQHVTDVLRRIRTIVSPRGSLIQIPFVKKDNELSAKFTVRFPTQSEEGLYSLYVHNCAEVNVALGKRPPVNLTLRMVEKNPESFLSAGQQPLPTLYFVLCCFYFFSSLVWLLYLRVSKNLVYRIHYLMFAVILVKSISLVFHGINYYVIGKHGVHEEGWAIMYYITHIFRGALLFITILLIGAGWAFIKYMLTPRERNLFLIVIPLQILANVATVMIEESEAGTARYAMWKDIFIFVDLMCCGAVLFPVVWSIRHLRAASEIDGKAAINLRNLRLFRRFYILVICYVYFTRMVAYLLTISMPYSLTWIMELFKESVTFGFFVAVGYTFRPVDNNPYLLVTSDEDEQDTVLERIQLQEIWSQSGNTDGVTRLAKPQKVDQDSFDSNQLTNEDLVA